MATKAHSHLGASNCKRWWSCPGSVRMCAGIENKGTSYANEGSAAHALAERCLQEKKRADAYLDCWISVEGTVHMSAEGVRESEKGFTTFYIDEEMCDAVQVYLDFVAETVEEGDEVEIEQRINLSQFHPSLFGTADLVVYKPRSKKLVVADYKHGRGVPVEVTENVQGLYYAAGAAFNSHNRGLESIEVVIVQPRCAHKDGVVRRWSTTAVDLLDWVADLAGAAAATEDKDAPLHAGDWCKFCPASGTCPAFAGAALEAAKADFDPQGGVVLTEPTRYSPDALAATLKNIDLVEAWCKSVRKFAHDEALKGNVLPGFKLVNTRATRKWINPDEARQTFEMLELDTAEYMSEPEMLTVAQVEKKVGKKAFRDFERLVTKRSSGVVLAPLDDPREPVKPEAAEEFA